MTDRVQRAQRLLERVGMDGLISGDAGTVAWLTGHDTPIATGASPFALSALVVLERSGLPILIVSDDELVEQSTRDRAEVLRYQGFSLDSFDRIGAARRVVAGLVSDRRLAVEAASVVVGLLDPGGDYLDITAALLRCRAVKDEDEIARLRDAIALCDAGQAAMRSSLQIGASELDVWSAITSAIEHAAGRPTPVLADLVSGPRSGETGGAPTDRVLHAGDLLLCDLVPRYRGYWGDSCATVSVGDAGGWECTAHQALRDALDAAMEAIRPGVRAGAIDALVRERLPAPVPHHVGHGLGCSSHELPRIVPGDSTVLEPGMVIALEPGMYDAQGVRLERVVAVVDDGFELLSGHDLEL